MSNNTKIKFALAAAITIIGLGCARKETAPEQICRVDQALKEYKSFPPHERETMLDSLRPEIEAFFKVYGADEIDDHAVLEWSEANPMGIFQDDVDHAFPNIDKLQQQVGHIHDNSIREGLTPAFTKIATVVWGKPMPIVVVDSVMLIALNHYLGDSYSGYSHLDSYRREDKRPEKLPYDIAAIYAASSHPFETSQTPTVLNWLLYEGALLEARMRLVDQPLLSEALGYRPDQMQAAEMNLSNLKKEMAEKKMLYSTDTELIDRLFAAAPVSPLLNGKAPGRIGRYIGYTIVKEYLRLHPTTTLDQLLSPSFYDNPQTLIETGF